MAINQGDQISHKLIISVSVAFSVEFDSRKKQDGKEKRLGGVGIINWSTVYHDSDWLWSWDKKKINENRWNRKFKIILKIYLFYIFNQIISFFHYQTPPTCMQTAQVLENDGKCYYLTRIRLNFPWLFNDKLIYLQDGGHPPPYTLQQYYMTNTFIIIIIIIVDILEDNMCEFIYINQWGQYYRL